MLRVNSGVLQCDRCLTRLTDLRKGSERAKAEKVGWVWINLRDYCAACAEIVFGSEYRRD